MKYLLLFALLVVAYAAWRGARARAIDEGQPPRPPAAPALPQDMVRCPVCSVHLPRPEAVPGQSGRLYCSPEHRRLGGN
ncbi:MAG TPA: PP0621 family protein [Ramlibacter sp.]|jgi:uncharacterized protein|uniref:PP0621 family protein n=1 Tax=Ramlibacter sp. TaxID=1917967 RepID=UPI002D6F9933|nr:PP0621 family protein [Ramlibacter sp.]HZY19800.1 PP0621 family protein [Ramlibacter sp.]